MPEELQPLDAAFVDLPERLLDEERPLLDRITAAGDRLAKEVDRVVVLGIGGSYMGARALFEACCHPYHNEISRQRRGGRPRIYFEGNNVDNDAVQGLLDLVEGSDDWGIIVISKSGGTLETAVAFRIFLDALRKSCGGDVEKFRRRVIPITGDSGRLHDLASALGCNGHLPHSRRRRRALLGPQRRRSAAGGRDGPRRAAPARRRGGHERAIPHRAAAGKPRARLRRHVAADGNPPRGHDPRAFHLGQGPRIGRAVVRPTSVRKSRQERPGRHAADGRQHPRPPFPRPAAPGRPPRQAHHESRRRDSRTASWIAIERSDFDQDKLNALSGKTLPEILRAAYSGTNQAYAEDYRRTATIRLPRLDEGSLGQLFQMLMLATVVEGRLVGINPYGQPGVEAYKKNMTAILRGK